MNPEKAEKELLWGLWVAWSCRIEFLPVWLSASGCVVKGAWFCAGKSFELWKSHRLLKSASRADKTTPHCLKAQTPTLKPSAPL